MLLQPWTVPRPADPPVVRVDDRDEVELAQADEEVAGLEVRKGGRHLGRERLDVVGVEGVGVNDNGVSIPGTKAVGIGALAVGNVKYRTEAGLFEKMIESEKPLYLDFRDAYALAQKLAA